MTSCLFTSLLNSPGRLLKPHLINKFPFKSILLGREMVPTCFSSSPFTVFVFLNSDESQNQASLPDIVPERSSVHFSPHKVAERPVFLIGNTRKHCKDRAQLLV